MQTIAQIQDGDMLTQGLFPSLAPNQLALWRDGSNVRFEEGRAFKSPGWVTEPTSVIVAQPVYDIVGLVQGFTDGLRRIFYGTTNGYNSLNLYDDGVYRLLGEGYSAGRWSMITFGTWMIATNDVDVPQIWKAGVAGAVALGGVNFLHAKIVRKLANHVFFLNLDTGGQRVQWTNASDPETSTSTIDNSAGGIDVRDLDGDIYACEPIGDALAFYSQDMMGTIVFTADSLDFNVSVKLQGIGAVGPCAVVARGTLNYGLGRKGFWQTDSFQFAYIHSPAVQKYLDSVIDWQQAETVVGFHFEKRNTIEWHFTNLNGAREGLAFNYEKGGWTKLAFPITAAIEEQVFSFPVVALGRELAFYGNSYDEDDAALTANLRTTLFDAGKPDNFKIWECVLTNITSQGDVDIRFGFSPTQLDADIEWTAWQNITRENFIPEAREAPYACFEVRAQGLSSEFEISGINLLGEIGGYI